MWGKRGKQMQRIQHGQTLEAGSSGGKQDFEQHESNLGEIYSFFSISVRKANQCFFSMMPSSTEVIQSF